VSAKPMFTLVSEKNELKESIAKKHGVEVGFNVYQKRMN
jgi:hypothetical protein